MKINTNSQGFTLLELLLVVVVIGVIAAIVIAKFGDVKEAAYVDAMKNDLRNLINAQEFYHDDHGTYRQVAELPGFHLTDGVEVEESSADTRTWSATFAHQGTSHKCAFNGGRAPEATGKIECTNDSEDSSSEEPTDEPTENIAPTASFTWECSDLTCDFTDASGDDDGSIASWLWNFGGDGSDNAESPSHTFSSAGTYTVVLTVTDSDGALDQSTEEVTVTAPPAATFRYWRVYVHAVASSTQIQTAEIGFLSGGVDQVNHAEAQSRAFASSEFSSAQEYHAFDGNTSSRWAAGSAADEWIAWDFGSGNKVDIDGLSLTSGSNATTAPRDFDIQYSADGSSWSTGWSIRGETGWAEAETRSFTKSDDAWQGVAGPRYWRVYVNSVDGGTQTMVSELQLRVNGVDQTVPSEAHLWATESSFFSGSEGYRAFDDLTSKWTGQTSSDEWVMWDFGPWGGQPIDGLAMRSRSDHSNTSSTPSNFDVQYSNDGISWTTASSITGETGWSQGEWRTFSW